MDHFARITSLTNLRAGWDKVSANRGGSGGDGVTVSEFALHTEHRLKALHLALNEGDYWPRPLRVAEIPKKGRGTRTLRIPAIADRVVQSAAGLVLSPILDAEFEDSSYGYRPGRSVQQAVRRVAALRRQGYVWTVDGDIEAFFDTVPHAPLLKKLSAAISCKRTVDLVATWLDAYCSDGRGLPQGSPISPLLANLHLDAVDEAIEKRGVRLVRFADDFLLLTRSEKGADMALGRMADILAKHGLRLNPEKTAIRSFDQATRFLGHLFVRGLTLREVEDGDAPTPTGDAGRITRALGLDADAITEPEEIGDPPAGTLSARRRWVYLTEPGRVLMVRGSVFSVRDGVDGAEIVAFHPDWADGIEIHPAAEADSEALRLALGSGIAVRYMAGDGGLLGSLDRAAGARAETHLAQAALVLDPDRRLDLAGRFVQGRLETQRAILRRLNEKRNLDEVSDVAHKLGRLGRLVRVQPSLDKMRGVEGQGGASYWRAFSALLDEWTLKTRKRRPPPCPVNLALSFLSMRLTGDVQAALTARGLHPGYGVLHEAVDGRGSLALDLMEAFRAPLVERVVIYLFNRNILTAENFSIEEGRVRVDTAGRQAMISRYEQQIAMPITDKRDGRRTRWRGVIENDIDRYLRHVRGEENWVAFTKLN